uniref:Uncharacterized protein n=1 Tax=Steinernema glaseri TaxID=37863 RepID=A0A1I7XX13_9BILA
MNAEQDHSDNDGQSLMEKTAHTSGRGRAYVIEPENNDQPHDMVLAVRCDSLKHHVPRTTTDKNTSIPAIYMYLPLGEV